MRWLTLVPIGPDLVGLDLAQKHINKQSSVSTW